MELTTITLGPDQLKVLKTILEFHLQNDEFDEYYSTRDLVEVSEKVGVEVPSYVLDELRG